MEKVTISITGDEIVTLVELEDGTVKHRSKMVSAGQSQQVEGDEWFDELADQDMAAALDDLDFGPFGVAGVLHRRASN